MSVQPVGRGRRRRWRILSLRHALVLVLAAALGLAWVAHSIRQQRQAKALILQHDGLYFYDFEPESSTATARRFWVPARLRKAIGDEYFHDVTWVRIEGDRFGDGELERMKALDRIEALGLVETAITDAGLSHLRGRGSLKSLALGGNWIGDAGIDALDLGLMPQLQVLELRCTLVSDAKIAEIKRRFPKLMILDDGPSHRYVVPGEGRTGKRLVSLPEGTHGPRRNLPAPRYHRAASGR